MTDFRISKSSLFKEHPNHFGSKNKQIVIVRFTTRDSLFEIVRSRFETFVDLGENFVRDSGGSIETLRSVDAARVTESRDGRRLVVYKYCAKIEGIDGLEAINKRRRVVQRWKKKVKGGPNVDNYHSRSMKVTRKPGVAREMVVGPRVAGPGAVVRRNYSPPTRHLKACSTVSRLR